MMDMRVAEEWRSAGGADLLVSRLLLSASRPEEGTINSLVVHLHRMYDLVYKYCTRKCPSTVPGMYSIDTRGLKCCTSAVYSIDTEAKCCKRTLCTSNCFETREAVAAAQQLSQDAMSTSPLYGGLRLLVVSCLPWPPLQYGVWCWGIGVWVCLLGVARFEMKRAGDLFPNHPKERTDSVRQ